MNTSLLTAGTCVCATRRRSSSHAATWRHTIIFDDSLNMFWRVPPDSAPSLDLRHNPASRAAFAPPVRDAMRVSVPRGAVRLHSDQPIKRSAQLSLVWARGASSR